MTDDNIVNLQHRRDGLYEAEIDAEVESIMRDLMRRNVGLVKFMMIAVCFPRPISR
jgi:hypothetical protein